ASLLSRPTFASPARPWIDVGCVPVSEKGARNAHHYGAPRSTKMGTIPSPWRYDAMTLDALRSPNLRLPWISHFASSRCAFKRLVFCQSQSILRRLLECTPDGGQIAGWELTGTCRASKDGSHG